MSTPIVDTYHKNTKAVIWQACPDGNLPEPVITLKQYSGGMVEIKQGDNEILLDASTLRPLAKLLVELARAVERGEV